MRYKQTHFRIHNITSFAYCFTTPYFPLQVPTQKEQTNKLPFGFTILLRIDQGAIYSRICVSKYQNIGACVLRMCVQDKGALRRRGDSDTAVVPRALQIDHHMCLLNAHTLNIRALSSVCFDSLSIMLFQVR